MKPDCSIHAYIHSIADFELQLLFLTLTFHGNFNKVHTYMHTESQSVNI